jgi:hypothetical protein
MVFGGCDNQQQKDQNAIIVFFAQLTAIQKEYQPKFEAEMGHSPFSDVDLYSSYYLKLNSINVSACPPDFKQAWSDCLHAERVCADDFTSIHGAGFIGSVLELKGLNPAWYAKMIQDKNARESAYNELKASAIRHGLRFGN